LAYSDEISEFHIPFLDHHPSRLKMLLATVRPCVGMDGARFPLRQFPYSTNNPTKDKAVQTSSRDKAFPQRRYFSAIKIV
jgi:hypothetical protein